MMAENGKITYLYTPDTWSQDEFLRLGGFTVVFLNYNKAAVIEKSVASALAQDFPLCEMFFMDDASTDGSGDTMERLVREYRGRHKVTVVRNDRNQHICGQWNIVSKLATGNWLGMFCGDDVSFPDRVSRAAEIVKNRPCLRGFCTSAKRLEGEGGNEAVNSSDSATRVSTEMKGTDSYVDFVFGNSAFGATAFWHKSLFNCLLLKGPLDDVILLSVLYAKNRSNPQVVWRFDRSVETVYYNVGNGISSTGMLQENPGRITYGMKVCERKYAHRINGLFMLSYVSVLRYLKENSYPNDLIRLIKSCVAYRKVFSCSSLARIVVLPMALINFAFVRDSALRKKMTSNVVRFCWKEAFGLHFAAMLDVGKGFLRRR